MNRIVKLLRLDYIVLVAILLLLNVPYWRSSALIFHDTAANFQGFYFFYNEFFHHGELARWMPFGLYGAPSDIFQLGLLSPACYFVGLAGYWLRVQDAFLLFKLAIFFEQWILLYGTYRLSGLLFERRSARFFATLGVLGGTIWFIQLEFNFRIYYLLPLALYFFVRFFMEARHLYLWLSGWVFTVHLLGTPAYYAVLNAWILTMMTIPLLFKYPAALKSFRRWESKDVLACAAFILAALPVLYFAAHALDGMRYYTPGRDPLTREATLEAFLTYGGNIGWKKMFGLVYPGPVDADNTIYTGLLPILFFIYALVYVRHAVMIACTVSAFGLFALSLGDGSFFASMLYHGFPMMKMYRHIGLVMGLFRCFMVLVAAFGLNHFLSSGPAAQSRSFLRRTGFTLLCLLLVFEITANIDGSIYPKVWPVMTGVLWSLLGIAVYLLTRPMPARYVGLAACFLLAADVLLYQYAAYRLADPQKFPETVYEVSDYSFQDRRTDRMQQTERSTGADEFARRATGISPWPYTISYSFIQVDPCLPQYRTDLLPGDIHRLFHARGGEPLIRLPLEHSILAALGCTESKLRFISEAHFAATDSEAGNLVRSAPNVYPITILKANNASSGSPYHANPEAVHSVTVESFRANELRSSVKVSEADGAWLYYADSFHKDWKAYLDGSEIPIAQANLAFKAVHLPEGEHDLRFVFDGGVMGKAGLAIAFFGLIFGVWMVAGILRAFVN